MLKLQGLDMINVDDVLATMDNNNSQMWLDIMQNGDSKINQYMQYVALAPEFINYKNTTIENKKIDIMKEIKNAGGSRKMATKATKVLTKKWLQEIIPFLKVGRKNCTSTDFGYIELNYKDKKRGLEAEVLVVILQNNLRELAKLNDGLADIREFSRVLKKSKILLQNETYKKRQSNTMQVRVQDKRVSGYFFGTNTSVLKVSDTVNTYVARVGGKHFLVNNLCPLITYVSVKNGLDTYIEPCGGGARMLLNLNKNLYKYRLYNEIDKNYAAAMLCMSDKNIYKGYKAVLQGLDYDENVFKKSKEITNNTSRDYVDVVNQGIACVYRYNNSLYNRGDVLDYRKEKKWQRWLKNLDKNHDILDGVRVTRDDALEILERNIDNPKALIYLDPPYLESAEYKAQKKAKNKKYVEKDEACKNDYKYSTFDHQKCLDLLSRAKCKVIVSHMSVEHYDKLLEMGYSKDFVKYKVSQSGNRMDEHIYHNLDITKKELNLLLNKSNIKKI